MPTSRRPGRSRVMLHHPRPAMRINAAVERKTGRWLQKVSYRTNQPKLIPRWRQKPDPGIERKSPISGQRHAPAGEEKTDWRTAAVAVVWCKGASQCQRAPWRNNRRSFRRARAKSRAGIIGCRSYWHATSISTNRLEWRQPFLWIFRKQPAAGNGHHQGAAIFFDRRKNRSY